MSFVIMASFAGMASGQTNMTLSGGPSFSLTDTNHPKLPPASHGYHETPGTLSSQPADLERYINALQSFVSVKVSPHGFTFNSTPSLAWIQLAAADLSLAKAPNIKRLTLGLLNEGRNMEMVDKRLADQSRSANSSIKSRPVVHNSSNFDPRRPPKFSEFPQQKQIEAMSKLRDDAQRQRTAIANAAAKWIDAMRALKNTPEGQQFSMPSDSAFYRALNSSHAPPSATGSTVHVQGQPQGVPSNIRVEVTSQTKDGVLGYLKKIVRLPDGRSMKGSDGEYVFEADRTKTIVITGYPKSVAFGESLTFKARQGESKVAFGQTLPQYIYVSEN